MERDVLWTLAPYTARPTLHKKIRQAILYVFAVVTIFQVLWINDQWLIKEIPRIRYSHTHNTFLPWEYSIPPLRNQARSNKLHQTFCNIHKLPSRSIPQMHEFFSKARWSSGMILA